MEKTIILIIGFIFGGVTVVLGQGVKKGGGSQLNPLNLPQLIGGIQERSDSLRYISEVDSNVDVFVIGRGVQTLDAYGFLEAYPQIVGNQITVVSFADFMTIRENTDSGAGWMILRYYLEENLTQLTVFKVSFENSVTDIYAVGLFQGHIVGVRMNGIET